MVTVRNMRAVAVYGAVPLALLLAGCSGSDGGDGKPSAPPVAASSTASSTGAADPDGAERKAVLAAYAAMSAEQAKAYRQADANGTWLEKYATLDALGQIRNDLARMKAAGTIVRGEIGHDAKVTALDMDAKTPKATLSDCVDLSKYQTYDTKADKVIPLPTQQPLRYVMTATAERWDGQWLVTGINPQGGPTC